MAERTRPGFTVPLDFYDGPEVKSIPKRIRSAAIGVWTLAGNYSATKLTDGYVDAETLRALGCTDAIRSALKATANVRGEVSPLWIDAHDGGIQFTNWAKWQRTNGEVSAYREAEAERKRRSRAAKMSRKSGGNTAYQRNSYDTLDANVGVNNGEDNPAKHDLSSDDSEMSGRTSAGRPGNVRSTKTETKTKTEVLTYVGSSATESSAREIAPYSDGISATRGADLVRANVPKDHPATTLTALRLQASELVNTGTDPDTVAAALRLWCDKPGVGIGRTILSSLCSEVIKTRNGAGRNGTTPTTSATDDKGSRWITGTARLDTQTQIALEAR